MRAATLHPAKKTHQAEEFGVRIPQPVLDDLGARLARTRWLDDTDDSWELGLSIPYLRELVRYWQHHFDWRAQETSINRFANYRATIGERRVHFIHQRGCGPKPLPIVLTHGFPDSFLRFTRKLFGSSDVPAGFAQFPKDLTTPPREWAERFFNVQRWTEMPSGGHIAALEEPERLAHEIREFFRPLRD